MVAGFEFAVGHNETQVSEHCDGHRSYQSTAVMDLSRWKSIDWRNIQISCIRAYKIWHQLKQSRLKFESLSIKLFWLLYYLYLNGAASKRPHTTSNRLDIHGSILWAFDYQKNLHSSGCYRSINIKGDPRSLMISNKFPLYCVERIKSGGSSTLSSLSR
jgi:hypothetical protein